MAPDDDSNSTNFFDYEIRNVYCSDTDAKIVYKEEEPNRKARRALKSKQRKTAKEPKQ